MNAWTVKRFMELWEGDRAFRAVVQAGFEPALVRHELDVDPDAIRALWDPDASRSAAACPLPPAAEDFRTRFYRDVSAPREATARLASADPRYAGWRARQIGRTISQTNPPNWANPHYPFAIELSVGCSIGCSYCCFAAPALRAIARFTSETAALFTGVLRVFADFFGEGADTGFLYWATDPLDNPDYERYQDAFEAVLGARPRTTTAAWHRNLKRTRRLIAASRRPDGVSRLRFSVNSLNQLHTCLQEFTAEDLRDVRLVLQNPESTTVRVATGRAAGDPTAALDSNTNVSGLIVNLVDRSVRLITPSTDLERWPLGHAILARGRFESPDALARLLDGWADAVMARELCDGSVPRLRADLQLRSDARPVPLTLVTHYTALTYEDPVSCAVLRAVDGHRSVSEIVDALGGVGSASDVRACLRRLFRDGMFEFLDLVEPTQF